MSYQIEYRYSIEEQAQTVRYNDRVDYEAHYWMLIRRHATAKGTGPESDSQFVLIDGEEQNPSRTWLLAAEPWAWRDIPLEVALGLMSHFTNHTQLSLCIGVGRNTVQTWKKTAGIPFFTWRYLLELLNIARPVARDENGIPLVNGTRPLPILAPQPVELKGSPDG